MLTALVVLAVLGVLFGAAALATYDGQLLVDPSPDDAGVDLPATALQPEDVAEVRFDMALRGYRMSEVDGVLARLAAELAARDNRISQLEQALVSVVEPAVTAAEERLAPTEPEPSLAVPAREEPVVAPPVDEARVPVAEESPVPLVEEPEALAPLDTGASAPATLSGPLTATTWWQASTPELATDDMPAAPEPAETAEDTWAQEPVDAPAAEPAEVYAHEGPAWVQQSPAPMPTAEDVPALTLPAEDDAFSFPELQLPDAAPEGAPEAEEVTSSGEDDERA